MILKIFADASPVGDNVDAEVAQQFSRTDAGALQNGRRMKRAGGENDFRAAEFLAAGGASNAQANRALAFEHDGFDKRFR